MKFLIIGQGGREHALVRALSLSAKASEIHALPGSDGMASQAQCHALDWRDFAGVVKLCQSIAIDVVVIGPEDPLVAGLADYLRKNGISTVGPSQAAAQLEGSKIFAKQFMQAAGIPTADFLIVEDVRSTLQAAQKFTPPYVLKADGLAAGKGVFICPDLADLEQHARALFVDKILGAAGSRAVLEQFTPGWELSYLIFTNGRDSQALPIAQDHKRLRDGDIGPNTGGMGTVAPMEISAELRLSIETKIVAPTLQEIQKCGLLYRGVIFFGLMISKTGPSLMEYNCRFGDPETQVILPLLEGDLGQQLHALASGADLRAPLLYKKSAAACVVMAAPGYPDSPEKDVPIEGDPLQTTSQSYFVHAGSKKTAQGQWVTHGGRVLGAVGLGTDVPQALQQAYAQSKLVHWEGQQLRADIGKQLLATKPVYK